MARLRIALVLLLCLPLIGCFDEPVREHLHLVFSGGEIVVIAVQQVAETERAQGNMELEDRLEEARAELEGGFDPWSQRFEMLYPLAEHLSLERVDGEVRRSVHSAVVSSFDEVSRMLEGDGLTGAVDIAGATAELQLFPTGGSRATSRQRDEVEHRLRTWSDQLADYFGAMIDLYAHLDARPDRALPCLAHVFDKHEGMGETGPLSSEEETLVMRVKEAMELVSEALLVDEGDAYSLNELTRLVYDPFPARLTLAVDGPVLRSEGFIVASDYLERPPVDAWRALIALEGRWAEPDLVTAMVAPAPENRQPDPDPSIIATLPRSYFSPPTAGEVESALLSELVPVEVHAVRWRQANPPSEERDEYDVNWLRVMADAEASVPN